MMLNAQLLPASLQPNMCTRTSARLNDAARTRLRCTWGVAGLGGGVCKSRRAVLLRSKEAKRVKSLIASARAEEQSAFASEREKEDWMKRQRESGGGSAPAGEGGWRWTLNWSPIVPGILVGSCPRSPQDIDRIRDESGATALVNLQSDVCFEALQIPFDSIKARAVERGVCLERVPVRDFDHGDQTFMLPQAVRMVNMLLARGHIVYIHCTAGINRASLTALGYLTFVKGMELDSALSLLKTARPIVHPYLDCWHSVRKRLLSGKHEQQVAVAAEMYEKRSKDKSAGDSASDWKQAQATVIARTFEQYLTVDLGKLEADSHVWVWEQREREEERVREAEQAEKAAREELAQLSAQGALLEDELKELSLRTLTTQLQSLASSSRALRLESTSIPLPDCASDLKIPIPLSTAPPDSLDAPSSWGPAATSPR